MEYLRLSAPGGVFQLQPVLQLSARCSLPARPNLPPRLSAQDWTLPAAAEGGLQCGHSRLQRLRGLSVVRPDHRGHRGDRRGERPGLAQGEQAGVQPYPGVGPQSRLRRGFTCRLPLPGRSLFPRPGVGLQQPV